MVSDDKRLRSKTVESYKTAESFGVHAKRRSGQRTATANRPQRQEGSLDLSDPVFSKYLKSSERKKTTDSSKPTRSTLDKFKSLIRRSRGQEVVDILKPEDAKSAVTSEYEHAVTAEDVVTVQDVTTGKLYRVPAVSRRATGLTDSSGSKYHNVPEDSRRLTVVPGSSERFVNAVEASNRFSDVIAETSSKVAESSGRFASATENLGRSSEILESSKRFSKSPKTSSRIQEDSEAERRSTEVPEASKRSTEPSEGSRRSTQIEDSRRFGEGPNTSSRIQENSEAERRFVQVPEGSRRSTEVPETSRRSTEILEGSRRSIEASQTPESLSRYTEIPDASRRYSEASEASKKTSEVPEISSRYQDISEASRRRSITEASRSSTRQIEVVENEISEESRRFTDTPQVVRDYQQVSGTSDRLSTVPEDSRRFTEVSEASRRCSEPAEVSRLVECSEPLRKFVEPCEPSSGVTAASETSKQLHEILEASGRFTGSLESAEKCKEAPKTSRRSTAELQASSRFQEVYTSNKENVGGSCDERSEQRKIPEESSQLVTASSTCQKDINEPSPSYQRNAKDTASTHHTDTKDSSALHQRKSKECSSVQQRDGKQSSSRHRSIAKQASSTAYTRKSSRASTRCRGQSTTKYTKSPERSSRSGKSSKVCKPCRHVKADNRRMTGNVNIYICSEGNDAGSCNGKKKADSPCNSTSEDNPSCTCSSTAVCLTPSSSAIKMTSSEAKEPDITNHEATATRPIEQEQLFNYKTLSIVPQIGGSEAFGLCDVSSFGHVSTICDSSKNLSRAKLSTWNKVDCESIRREDNKSERSRSRSSTRNALADSGIYNARSKFTTCLPAPRCYKRAPNYPDPACDKFIPCRCPDPDEPRDDEVLAKRCMSRSQENNRIPARSELICNCCSYEGFDVPSGERARDLYESAYNPSENEVWQAPRLSSRSANYNGDNVSKKTTFSCDARPKMSALSNRLSNKKSTSQNMCCGLAINSSTNIKSGRNIAKSDSCKKNSAMKVSRTRADYHSTKSISENESFQPSSSARAARSSDHRDSVKSILRNESGEQRSLRQSCDWQESKTSALRDVESRARSNSSGYERETSRETGASSRSSVRRRMVAEKPNESRRSSSKAERSWVNPNPELTVSASKHDESQYSLVEVVESSPQGVQDRPPNSTQIHTSAVSTTSKSPTVTCQANSGTKAKSAAEVPRKSSLKWPFSKTKSLISSYRQNRQSKKDSCPAEYPTSGATIMTTGPVSSTIRSIPRGDLSLRTSESPTMEASSRPDPSVNSAALEQVRKRHSSNGKNRPSSSSTLAIVLAKKNDSKQSNLFDAPTQTSDKLRSPSGSDVGEADSCGCQCPQCCRSNSPREEPSYERTRNSWQKPSQTDDPESPEQLSSRGKVVRVCRLCCMQPRDCRCSSPVNRLSREPSDSSSKSLSCSDSLGPKSQICLYCDQPEEICICRAPIKKCSYCGMLLDVCNCNEVLTVCTTCGLNGQTCQCNGRLIQNPDDEGDPGICVTAWKPRRDVRKYFSREPDDQNVPDCTCCVSGKPYGSEELPYQRLSAFSDVMSELQQKMSEMSCDQCGKRPCCCCYEPSPTYRGFSSSAIEKRPYSSNIRGSRSRSPAPYRACSELSPCTPATCKIPLQICDRCRTSPCRCRRSRSSQNKPGAKCYYCKFTPCRCEVRNTVTPRSCMCIETPSCCRLEMTAPQVKKNLSSLSARNQSRRFCPCGSPRCRISRGQSRRLSESYRTM